MWDWVSLFKSAEQIVNACQRKVAHTKKTLSSLFRGKFAGIRMPSGLPDDLADLPADIQNYMSVKNTTSEISPSNLVIGYFSPFNFSPGSYQAEAGRAEHLFDRG